MHISHLFCKTSLLTNSIFFLRMYIYFLYIFLYAHDFYKRFFKQQTNLLLGLSVQLYAILYGRTRVHGPFCRSLNTFMGKKPTSMHLQSPNKILIKDWNGGRIITKKEVKKVALLLPSQDIFKCWTDGTYSMSKQ